MGSTKTALATMVRDEALFFPIFLGYYSQHFAPEDIYVLDHQTVDGSTSRDGFVRIPVTKDDVDFEWMVEMLGGLQRDLLGRYDAVLIVDVDELVAPDPRLTTLRDYLAAFRDDFVNCHGWEILHRPDKEPPFDRSRPVLDQRGYWFESGLFNKPALSSEPLEWIPGFHARTDGRMNLDPDLYMVHLHRLDYQLCLEKHHRIKRRRWTEESFRQGWSAHQLITEDEEFSEWFNNLYQAATSDPGLDGFRRIQLRRIPPHWRGLF